jgi:lantibiotic modifying enzyme
VAYTFLILQQMYNDLEIEGQLLGTWSAAYLKQAQDTIGDYPGPNVDMVGNLCDYSAEVLDPETDNEFLYGRGGYLYLLRLVKASFVDDPKTLQLITDTQDDVVDAILDSPRPWKWHGKTYVGAIHGAIGIITQVVFTDPKKYAPKVEADLAVLLTYQYETGNWPSTIPPEKDRLVQVCHGAAGVVNSLVCIKKYFPNLEEKITRAIVKGRECVRERGLLTKEPCLCHGMYSRPLSSLLRQVPN